MNPPLIVAEPYREKYSHHNRPFPGKGDVITLIISNDTESFERKMHCMNCGMVIFHYYGAVRIVIMGDLQAPKEIARPVDLMCGGCKLVYRIS